MQIELEEAIWSLGRVNEDTVMTYWWASNEGIDVVILNPSIILGPGDWYKGSSKIFQRIFLMLTQYVSEILNVLGQCTSF